ncbi:MAG: superinfection immunity protein [Verrucomicrobiaceae bacterium]|nr:superinfection immunity protein [Verrucomicrobiaceae bacterium]
MDTFLLILCFVVVILIYFFPTIIAFGRKHNYKWLILILNLFGATGITWLIALVWAVWPRDDFLN